MTMYAILAVFKIHLGKMDWHTGKHASAQKFLSLQQSDSGDLDIPQDPPLGPAGSVLDSTVVCNDMRGLRGLDSYPSSSINF